LGGGVFCGCTSILVRSGKRRIIGDWTGSERGGESNGNARRILRLGKEKTLGGKGINRGRDHLQRGAIKKGERLKKTCICSDLGEPE